MSRHKLHEAWVTKDFDTFFRELEKFLAFIIRKYVKYIPNNGFEELRDELRFRVYYTLEEHPFDETRSNFLSYVFSIARNGISSWLNKAKKEIPVAEVRDGRATNFCTEVYKTPDLHPDFHSIFPAEVEPIKTTFSCLVEEEAFNEAVWERMSEQVQNYMRVMAWNVYVRDR